MKVDLMKLREWPIVSFSVFTLGVFAARDFGPGFEYAIGLVFLAVAMLWVATSVSRRRGERDVDMQRASA